MLKPFTGTFYIDIPIVFLYTEKDKRKHQDRLRPVPERGMHMLNETLEALLTAARLCSSPCGSGCCKAGRAGIR